MVAQATQNSTLLAPLSPEDEALFHRFIESGASLSALADSLKSDALCPIRPIGPIGPIQTNPATAPTSSPLPTAHSPLPSHSLPSLYLWSTQPHIAPWLAFHKSVLADEHHREMIAHQREMLTHLRELAKAAPTPVERRRAASSVLRAIAIPPIPIGHNTTRSSRTIRHDSHTPPAPLPPSPVHPLTSSPVHPENPNHPFPPSPDLPAPLATPSPEHPDHAVAELALSLLREPEDKRNHSTLRAFSTPRTLFVGMQVPTNAAAFSQRAADILRHHESPRVDASRLSRLNANGDANPLASAFRLTTTQGNRMDRSLHLSLRRETQTDPWLIASLGPAG